MRPRADQPASAAPLGPAPAGLPASLTGRRRIWFRLTPAATGSHATAAGLAGTEYANFRTEFDTIVTAAQAITGQHKTAPGNAASHTR